MKKIFILMLFITISTLAFAERDYQDMVYLKDSSTIHGIEMQVQPDYSYSSSGLKRGYQGIVEMGYGFKVTDNGYNFLKVNVINGYRINPKFYLGFGTGLRLYFDNHALFNSFAAYPVIPFFADFRVILNNRNVSAYSSFDIGYSFDASDGFKGLGSLLNPTAGVHFKISDKLTMNVGVGYEMQFVTDYASTGSTVNYGAVSINIGISF